MNRPALALVGLVAAVAIAACGGTSATASPSSAAASQPVSQPSSDAAGGETAVAIVNSTFDPESLTVAAGDTVTWTSEDTLPHSVVFEDDAIEDSGNLNQGDTFEATFADAGTYAYICGIHSFMTGTVVVE